MIRCPICGAGGLANLEYKGKTTDKGRFTTCKCKKCKCVWHVAIYPGKSTNHINAVIRNYLLEGKKVAAIKALRSVSHLGLKEAKAEVDGIESGMYVEGVLTARRRL
jgi:formate dehydrogenase maturation protein FdhE